MIKPIKDRVVLKVDEKEEKTAGGIIIPDANDGKEKPRTGTVLETGPDADLVEKGQKVIFAAYAGSFVKIDGDEMLILKQDEIMAILGEING